MTTALAPQPGKLTEQRRAANARARRTTGSRAGDAAAGIAAWIIGLLFFFPVLWMVLTSLHSEANASTNPPSFFAPLTLEGYREFFGASTGA
jgi:sorbitol/mannitol transport system permease protein